MKRLNKIIFFLLLLFFLPGALFAYDFSLVTNVHTGFGSQVDDGETLHFRADLWPRFSMPVGDNGNFTISAGLTFGVKDDSYFIPELQHTEFLIRLGRSGIRIGRMNYSDPLSFVSRGLFDGFQFFHNTDKGSLNIGIWYTGLLYKKSANITMNMEEEHHFEQPIDFGDFFNTYFAPARIVTAIGWEHRSLWELMHLNTAIVAQIDLTETQTKYNSQYLIVKAAIPQPNFMMEFGGAIELSQSNQPDDQLGLGFAGEVGLYWLLPANFNSRLSTVFRYAGGGTDDLINPFTPITTRYFGNIISPKFSGISVLSLVYSARFIQALGATFSASYFVRNDLGSFAAYPVSPGSEGFFLGPEIYGRIVWSPFSDLQFNLGGGAFFPSLGDAGPTEPVNWKLEVTMTMALF